MYIGVIISTILFICYTCIGRLQMSGSDSTNLLKPSSLPKLPFNLSEARICDKYYSNSKGNCSLLVVPRRAYYDHRRAWKPGKGNVVVILTEMSDLAFGSFIACEINGHYTSVVDDVREDTKWIRANHKGYTYSLVIVFCLFVPQEAIVNGASVKLIHKSRNDNCYSRVETEFPLVVKPRNSTIDRGPNSVLVCVSVFKRPPYFSEWLKYQQRLGVDMVHINADPTFVMNATSRYPYLKKSLDSGFAVMEEWNDFLGEKLFWYSELIKYQDCVMQYLGVFQYAFMLDADDFFNPVLPDHKNIHYYMGEYFNNPTVCTKVLNWVTYCKYPDLSKSPSDGNLTALVQDGKTKPYQAGKAVHKLDNLLFVNIHKAHTILKGCHSDEQPSPIAYVSHIRPQKNC